MPPKSAATSTAMSEETYYLWACLRVLAAKTGEQPNWELISKALGGTTKAHSMYIRYNNYMKKAAPGFNSDLPNLEELIGEAQTDGTLAKTRKSLGGAGPNKTAVPKATKAIKGKKIAANSNDYEDIDDVEEEAPKSAAKGRKRAAPAGGAKGRGKKVKAEEEEDVFGNYEVKKELVEADEAI